MGVGVVLSQNDKEQPAFSREGLRKTSLGRQAGVQGLQGREGGGAAVDEEVAPRQSNVLLTIL